VIELKASVDVLLLMQAIDYWLRVRHHQELGDFPRFGYFPGLIISSQLPTAVCGSAVASISLCRGCPGALLGPRYRDLPSRDQRKQASGFACRASADSSWFE